MNFTLAYITTSDAIAIAQGSLPSPTMFLVSSFSALCSLITLLGTVGAQSLSSSPPTIESPASSVVSSSFSPPPSQFSSSLSTEPSSTYPGSSLTSLPASSTSLGPPVATNGFSTIGNVLKPTITSYPFDPFPAPSESSIPKVFPESYPDNPPPAGDSAIPNFDLAWAAAHRKARTRVGHAHLFCFHSNSHVIVTGSGFDARRKSQYHHWRRLDERFMRWKYSASRRFPWSLFGCTFAFSSWVVSADFEGASRTHHSE